MCQVSDLLIVSRDLRFEYLQSQYPYKIRLVENTHIHRQKNNTKSPEKDERFSMHIKQSIKSNTSNKQDMIILTISHQTSEQTIQYDTIQTIQLIDHQYQYQ